MGRVADFDHLFVKEPPEHVGSAAFHQSLAKANDVVSKHTPKPFLKGGGGGGREGEDRERKRGRGQGKERITLGL